MVQQLRKQYLTRILLAAVAIFLLDQAISYYTNVCHDLATERDGRRKALEDSDRLLAREKAMREFLAGMGASIASDDATVEDQLLHRVHEWEQVTSVTDVSFRRLTDTQESGFTRLVFQVSATGRMPSVAGLLYQIESAPMPLRIDNIQLHPKDAGGDSVQMVATISTICKANPPPARARQAAVDAPIAGGNG